MEKKVYQLLALWAGLLHGLLGAMDPVKQKHEPVSQSGSAAQGSAGKPIVLLSQEEFDEFSTMIDATAKKIGLLALYEIKKDKDKDSEFAIRLSFIDYALMKDMVRIEAFLRAHGIAKQESSFVAQFKCSAQKIDKRTLNQFIGIWNRFLKANEGVQVDRPKSVMNLKNIRTVIGMRVDNNDRERDKLIDAICAQNFDRVGALLKQKKVDVNSCDVLSHVPLMYAVMFNDYKIAKLLIDNGSSVECIDSKGVILPMLINEGLKGNDYKKDEKNMRHLLRHVTPNFLDGDDGCSPLMRAVKMDSKIVAQVLLRKSAQVTMVARDGKTTAYSLSKNSAMRGLLGDEAIFFELKHQAALEKAGAQAKQKEVAAALQDCTGQLSATQDVQVKAHELIKANFMLRIQAFRGSSHEKMTFKKLLNPIDALQIEHMNNEHDKSTRRIMSFFKEKGIPKGLIKKIFKDNNQEELSDFFVENYEILLSDSVPIVQNPLQRKTELLIDAIRTGDFSVVQATLVSFDQVNGIDIYGQTPLFYAVLRNDMSTAQALIAKGANVNFKTNEGMIPLLLAWDEPMKELLSKFGARLDHKDEQGQTPLQTAMKNSDRLIAQAIHELLQGKAGGDSSVIIRPLSDAEMKIQNQSAQTTGNLMEKQRDDVVQKFNANEWAPIRKKTDKQLAKERAAQQKIETDQKLKKELLARKQERERIAYYRGLGADFVRDLWSSIAVAGNYCLQLQESQRVQEQSLMHREDMKMLSLQKIVNKFQLNQYRAWAWNKWQEHVRFENDRCALLKRKERFVRATQKLEILIHKQKHAVQAVAFEKMKIFAWVKTMEEETARQAEKQRKIKEEDDAWQQYRTTGIETLAHTRERRRREQLQRRKSAQDLIDREAAKTHKSIVASKKLNPLAPEFVLKIS